MLWQVGKEGSKQWKKSAVQLEASQALTRSCLAYTEHLERT